MTIQEGVSSLEPSKRLNELGVKQKSLCYWHDDRNLIIPEDEPNLNRCSSAFTVAELGEMLPLGIETLKLYNQWRVFLPSDGMRDFAVCVATTEADARAKMLIHLLENKSITL